MALPTILALLVHTSQDKNGNISRPCIAVFSSVGWVESTEANQPGNNIHGKRWGAGPERCWKRRAAKLALYQHDRARHALMFRAVSRVAGLNSLPTQSMQVHPMAYPHIHCSQDTTPNQMQGEGANPTSQWPLAA